MELEVACRQHHRLQPHRHLPPDSNTSACSQKLYTDGNVLLMTCMQSVKHPGHLVHLVKTLYTCKYVSAFLS